MSFLRRHWRKVAGFVLGAAATYAGVHDHAAAAEALGTVGGVAFGVDYVRGQLAAREVLHVLDAPKVPKR